MKTYVLLACALVVGQLSIVGEALATPCSGNACSAITVQKRNGCLILVNGGDKKVRVEVGDMIYRVYARSEQVAYTLQGPCFTDVLRITADYEG